MNDRTGIAIVVTFYAALIGVAFSFSLQLWICWAAVFTLVLATIVLREHFSGEKVKNE